MKHAFKDIYLPIKAGIIGELHHETQKQNDDLIKECKVSYNPDKPIGKWVITAVFHYRGQTKAFHYGKTRKEIKALINDLNDFDFDPHLFLNL